MTSARIDDRIGGQRSRLADAIARSIGVGEVLATAVPGLTLYRQTASSGPLLFTCQASLAVVAQGRKRMELDREAFLYDSSRFLLTSLDLPATSQVLEASPGTPYLCMVLDLDSAVVRDLLSQHALAIPEPPAEGPAMATGENTPELLDACSRLVELLDRPGEIPILRAGIEREILYRILVSNAGARLRSIALQGSRNSQVARAISWIRENYAKHMRVEDLAKLAGMGVSTFHNHFRELTFMTPLQYQKRLRLHAARRRMLLEDLDASSAAFEVGYESASQFSRDYRRHFGQPPLRDVSTLRSAGPLALNLAGGR